MISLGVYNHLDLKGVWETGEMAKYIRVLGGETVQSLMMAAKLVGHEND
jgi:hypothetical protein